MDRSCDVHGWGFFPPYVMIELMRIGLRLIALAHSHFRLVRDQLLMKG